MASIKRFFFDPADYELVELVNRQMARGVGSDHVEHLFDPYLHPRGIKELAAPIHKRIAYAVIQLLATLEAGHADERVAALRSLRDEVFNGSSSALRHNTARVLLAIMKELVKDRGNQERQLRRAHDFFAALSGRPSVIRSELKKYHLLEMPEAWNQVALDHHVHDANSKGRKSPTHLILDAWIKGIRDLNVIYYNFILPEAAAELSEAAEILGVKLRIGIELAARFRGKYVHFIWTPRGFQGREDFLEFLESEGVKAFFAAGQEVADWRKRQVLELLASFNAHHREALNKKYSLTLEPLDPDQFLAFVGVGQASVAHLAEYIHGLLLSQLQDRVAGLQERFAAASAEEKERLERELELINELVPERIYESYLRDELNPDVPSMRVPSDEPDTPALLKLSPQELVEKLTALRTGYRLTLNPTGVLPADVLELIYDLEGAITHVEIYNLKDRRQGLESFPRQLEALRRSLNGGNPTAVKQAVRAIVQDAEAAAGPEDAERIAKLRGILRDIPRFIGFYRSTPLRSRIGSDSIGRAGSLYGMGLVVRETLPWAARRAIARNCTTRETIPVRVEVRPTTTWEPRSSLTAAIDALYARFRELPLPRRFGYRQVESYAVDETATRIDPQGNVVTLGGIDAHPSNHFRLVRAANLPARRLSWRELNTNWKNGLKVLVGFLPAFLTFFLTKDWWLLAWLGAPIWFAITGLRNVLQAVVAGGGLMFRSPLIKWNNLVSWERVTDSLLYTGFSVPLLDWLIKSVVLDRGFGVTTTTAPVLLYTVMAVANGIYLASHNSLRGLPRAAAVGNMFRSVLSIPIAVGLNAAVLAVLQAFGWQEAVALEMLQKWAAIIAKVSSDLMAGIIEGSADRSLNLRLRRSDYRTKIAQVLDIYGRLELLFPENDVLEVLASRVPLAEGKNSDAHRLERRLILNALDLMYFWMYQPRARYAAKQIFAACSPDEQRILLGTQQILDRERQITQMFLDHLVGRKFAHPLAFYLDKWSTYLAEVEALARSVRAAAERKQGGKAELAQPAVPKAA